MKKRTSVRRTESTMEIDRVTSISFHTHHTLLALSLQFPSILSTFHTQLTQGPPMVFWTPKTLHRTFLLGKKMIHASTLFSSLMLQRFSGSFPFGILGSFPLESERQGKSILFLTQKSVVTLVTHLIHQIWC